MTTTHRRSTLLLVVLVLAWMLVARGLAPAPALADLDFIAFESCTTAGGAPCPPSGAGDAPVGAALKFRFFTDCPAVQIDWGDRNPPQTARQPANTINAVTATHRYERAGEFTITATDQCDRVTETSTVTIGGGTIIDPAILGSPAAVAALLGAVGGAALLALAFAPLGGSASAAMAGAAGTGASAPGTGYSAATGYVTTPPSPPPTTTPGPDAAPVPPPIQGEAGVGFYQLDTGRLVGASPESPPQAIPAGDATELPPFIGQGETGVGSYQLDTGRVVGASPQTGPTALSGAEPGLPEPIQGGGQSIGGAGASVGPQPIGPLSVTATWNPGSVTLAWPPPAIDPSQATLLQYEVNLVSYTPNSTLPVSSVVATLPPGANQATLGYVQTYVNSTSGDIVGFRIDQVFSQLSGGQQVIFRIGGLLTRVGTG